MLEGSWKTIEGKPVPDMVALIREMLAAGEREIHVGTDSQQAAKKTEFVTVVVLLEKGKGGRAFYCREQTDRIRSLRERLMREVYMSIQVGLQMNALIPETVGLTIHVDANPNLKFKSSNYVQELAGMVVGQGFKTLLKPDSWAASHAADHVVKTKILHM